jgi:hypothetical protein
VRSEGILLGVDLEVFDIREIDERDCYVKFDLCNKRDNFKWALVVVYGPVQEEQKVNFLAEMVNMCSWEALPILIGGSFNILRRLDEKNKSNYNDRWPFLFNAVIDNLNPRELEMTDKNYTWANSLEDPTYEKLDKILMSTEWEQKFPLSTVVAGEGHIGPYTTHLRYGSNFLL